MKEIEQFLKARGYTLDWYEDGILSYVSPTKRFIVSLTEGTNHIHITDKNRNSDTRCGYFHFNLFVGKVDSLEDFKKLSIQLSI